MLFFILFTVFSYEALSGSTATASYFKLDEVRKSHKPFIDASNYVQEQYNKIMQDLSVLASELENDKRNLDNNPSNLEAQRDFQSKLSRLEQEKNEKQSELNNAATIFEEQARTKISEVASTIFGSAKLPLIEGTAILYGGADITKQIISSLNTQKIATDIDKKSPVLKIGYIDMSKFKMLSPAAKEATAFIEKKVNAFQDKQKQFMEKMNSPEFDKEAAEQELKSMVDDIHATQQVMGKQIENNLKKVGVYVAEKNGFHLIIDKAVVFANGEDVTELIIKNYDTAINSLSEPAKSIVAHITIENVLQNLTKYKNVKAKYEKQKLVLDEELSKKYAKIQEMKDKSKNSKQINLAEEDFGREKTARMQALMNSIKSEEEIIMKDIRNAAQKVGKSGEYSMIFLDSERGSGIYYSGNDVSAEILSVLNG
jgi:Skp family chaperone for outer membrane proteins